MSLGLLNYWLVIVLMMTGLYVVIESWLNEKATDDNRGQVFSAYILIT